MLVGYAFDASTASPVGLRSASCAIGCVQRTLHLRPQPGRETMEMHQVRYFLAVARTLNFTRAAEECNVTQPSLTRAVQKLEDELGGLLFRRERALTHLTDLGRMMLPHLQQTFDAAQAAKNLAKGIGKAQVAPLTLGVAHSADSEALSEVLRDVADSLPGFELTVDAGSSAELIERGLKGDVDLLVVESPDEAPERLESWELYRHRYHLVARTGHALGDRAEICLAETADESWIDCGSDGSARLRRAAERVGGSAFFKHKAGSPLQALQLASAGFGSAVLPRPASGAGRLVALALIEEDFLAPVVLAGIAGRRRSAAADAFVRAARARRWEDR
jgi:DNA-binding transcriptional LysR family regulator